MTSNSTVFSARRETCKNKGLVLAGIQRTGMLDWPGRVTATAFTAGCNLRCPYCHNPELVHTPRQTREVDELLSLVRERSAWLDGVVITGGEPCLHEGLVDLCRELKAIGCPVKLDTNGTMPERLRHLLENDLVDFVALDVKATPEKYERACGVREVWSLVKESIDLVLASGVSHEFRTTCYPLAVDAEDLVRIASTLRGGNRYALQQFRPTARSTPRQPRSGHWAPKRSARLLCDVRTSCQPS